MVDKVLKILLKTYNNIFILTGVLLLLFAGAIYLLLGKEAVNALTEQMLHREQIVARAGAVSLNIFVSDLGSQILAYSVRPSIKSFDTQNAQKDLEIFLDGWGKTSVSGVILVDSDGNVRYSVDHLGITEKGTSVAGQEYFEWAKSATEGDVFVGSPILSKNGFAESRFIVPVASPVMKDERFNGVIVTSFFLDELTSKYLDPLRITDKTNIYLLDQSGLILSGSVQKLVGINYLDYIGKSGIIGGNKVIQILSAALSSKSENKIDIALPDETNNNVLTRYLIAYSPILIGNNHWILGVMTPVNDALVFLTPFYFRNLGLAGLAFLAFLIIAIRISKITGYREGIEEGRKVRAEPSVKPGDNV